MPAATYPAAVTCQRDGCDWTHQADDQDDAIDAWEQHVLTDCTMQRSTPAPGSTDPQSSGPDDPIGTVRAGAGILAIRAHSAHPDHDDDPVWYVIDIGGQHDPDHIEQAIVTWPIVYQP